MRAHVTIQMETLDSDEDFKQPSPMQVAFALHYIKMDVLCRERGGSKLYRTRTREASALMVCTRTRVGSGAEQASS